VDSVSPALPFLNPWNQLEPVRDVSEQSDFDFIDSTELIDQRLQVVQGSLVETVLFLRVDFLLEEAQYAAEAVLFY
jgi:hypothetical protein